MRFPSDTLYDSKLTAAESAAGRLLRDLPGVKAEAIDVDGLEGPVLFIDSKCLARPMLGKSS